MLEKIFPEPCSNVKTSGRVMKIVFLILHLKLANSHFSNSPNRGFPGGSVVKHWPVNAGKRGLIPDQGGAVMAHSNDAGAPLLSLCS